MIGFIALIPHDSEIEVIIAPSLISKIHSSPERPLSLFHPAVFSPTVPWQRLLTVEMLQIPLLRSVLRRL
jgi:hypothetical protein